MDIWQRRGLLDAVPNPDRRLDYVSMLSGEIAPGTPIDGGQVSLRYVPDTLIIMPDNFGTYLTALNDLSWTSQEEIATTILNDVNNEVVARWVQVIVSSGALGTLEAHHVMVEDRQPQWDNGSLLSRLKPY